MSMADDSDRSWGGRDARTPRFSREKGEAIMKFVVLIYHGTSPLPGSTAWKALPEAEQKAIYADYAALNKTSGVTPGLPSIAPNVATTVQVRDGKVQVKNGSLFAESLGGALVFDADNIEAAIALAARIPQARLGGAVEIRPCEKYF
jgi:hypothetical protein